MVKVGIIGAGRIGRVHINSITTRVPNAKIKNSGRSFFVRRNSGLGKKYGSRKDYKRLQRDHS